MVRVFLLVTVAGVALGIGYATAVGRRPGLRDPRAWALLAPVWVAYAVVLLAGGVTGSPAQAVQAVALGSLVETAAGTVRLVASTRRGSAAGAGPRTP
ncbi:hypothetical protein [Cellulomonas olei]|uniref:hypothetical protein n=1 Tax=Cellulomonas sp. P4 TaxID=3142533 RepID=UPI0031BB6FEC